MQIGAIKKGTEVGKKCRGKYIWAACEICGKERWVQFVKGKAATKRCKKCESLGRHHSLETKSKLSLIRKGRYIGEKHPNWRGGKHKDKSGYVLVLISVDDFFYPMARKGQPAHYIFEHRLVMAKHLGRCILPWEVVHHKNGIKDDNRVENLALLPDKRFHLVDMLTKAYIRKLEERIKYLEMGPKGLG